MRGADLAGTNGIVYCAVVVVKAANKTDLPIGYIAGAVGYETQSYFNLQFTKHVGMSPKRFRNNYVVSSLQFSSSRKQSRKQA